MKRLAVLLAGVADPRPDRGGEHGRDSNPVLVLSGISLRGARASTSWAVASMPLLQASGGRSSATAAIWARTVSTGTAWPQPCAPSSSVRRTSTDGRAPALKNLNSPTIG